MPAAEAEASDSENDYQRMRIPRVYQDEFKHQQDLIFKMEMISKKKN